MHDLGALLRAVRVRVATAVASARDDAVDARTPGAQLGHARGDDGVGAQRAFDGRACRLGQLAVDECNQEFV